MLARRDFDAYDDFCDHLLVLDNSLDGDVEDQVVGTYRLLRQEVAMRHGGFYSAGEFDIEPLLARHPDKQFMELGRSCVLPNYRTKRTVELLWQGNWAYALKYKMGAMFGCASFPGTQPEEHALALSFWRRRWVRTANGRFPPGPSLPADGSHARRGGQCPQGLERHAAADQGLSAARRHGQHGGSGGSGLQHHGVLIILPIASISDRYVNYYGADAGRFAS